MGTLEHTLLPVFGYDRDRWPLIYSIVFKRCHAFLLDIDCNFLSLAHVGASITLFVQN